MAAAPALYLHVADDGGLLVIEGETGRSAWITEAELFRRVGEIGRTGGALLLSRERGLSSAAARVLEWIRNAGVPVVPASETHPEAFRREGATALMSAAYSGDMELVDDLLRRGADVAAQDTSGFTALMYAANAQQEEVVKSLINAAVDLNQTDHEGSTALMFAAQHGHLKLVKRLLAAGADPRARRGVDGLTARDFAARNGHARVAAVLDSTELQRP